LHKSLFVTILPAFLFAGDIAALLENHNGVSSYYVQSPTLKIESELIFPFEFNTFALAYSENIYNFIFTLKSDFLFHSNSTAGKDFDWHNGNLSVFSTSDNTIDSFNSYSVGVSKNIFENFDISSRFLYKKIDISWSHTIEEDFVKKETITHQTLSLEYQQSFYQYNLGLRYTTSLLNSLQFNIEPSMIYTYIQAKDFHILRNFYTMQDAKAFGYELKTEISREINKNSTIALHYAYETYSDYDTPMCYYNALNQNYLTLPSTYKYTNSIIGLRYIFLY